MPEPQKNTAGTSHLGPLPMPQNLFTSPGLPKPTARPLGVTERAGLVEVHSKKWLGAGGTLETQAIYQAPKRSSTKRSSPIPSKGPARKPGRSSGASEVLPGGTKEKHNYVGHGQPRPPPLRTISFSLSGEKAWSEQRRW